MNMILKCLITRGDAIMLLKAYQKAAPSTWLACEYSSILEEIMRQFDISYSELEDEQRN